MDPQVEVSGRHFRGRRRARGSRRGLYLLPHLITTAGLFFGFWAIIQAPTLPDLAAVGIILAMVCDALDGRVARFAKSTSRFGVEYDSIEDTVSFAVAPSILAFSAGNLQVLGRPGWIIAFLFTVCAALRLARFNVSPGRYRGRFEGLPSPAAAGVVASTQVCATFLRENGVFWTIPESVLACADDVVRVPMHGFLPSYNLQAAMAVVMGERLRQAESSS